MSASRPPFSWTMEYSWTLLKALQISVSVVEPVGSALRLTVPFIRSGLCETPLRRDRTVWRGIFEMSVSSIDMLPVLRSNMRKMLITREVLPLDGMLAISLC